MAAGRYDIIIDQGSDFSFDFIYKEDGSAKDLTGYLGRGQMRPKKSSETLTGTFVVTITTPAAGAVTVSMSNSVNKLIAAGKYYYDIELYTAADAIVNRILEGEVLVTTEVTR